MYYVCASISLPLCARGHTQNADPSVYGRFCTTNIGYIFFFPLIENWPSNTIIQLYFDIEVGSTGVLINDHIWLATAWNFKSERIQQCSTQNIRK